MEIAPAKSPIYEEVLHWNTSRTRTACHVLGEKRNRIRDWNQNFNISFKKQIVRIKHELKFLGNKIEFSPFCFIIYK